MKKCILLLLPVVSLLLAGCPRNEYTVSLTPQGDKIKRELTFYRGENETNGNIKYEGFPEEELDTIKAAYPSAELTRKGEVYTVKREFADTMPADVGGAGNYTNLTTSLGSAGFYGERFRGDDDPIGQTEKRIKAANEAVDLLIGWSKAELGAETNYPQLRKFLDEPFRKDVKNAVFYWRQAAELRQSLTNIDELNNVRFAQYLMERGYFKLSDVPALFQMLYENDDARIMGFIQRLVARKMGVPDAQPVPASLAFLSNSAAMGTSFSNYFIGTDLYRSEVKEWEAHHKEGQAKPTVDAVSGEKFMEVIGIDFQLFGDPREHLKVQLSLPVPPARTNGKWDEDEKQVVWDGEIESRTNSIDLPMTCYASWGQPDESFQKQHFGSVILTGEDLTYYCVWRAGLDPKRSGEWEGLLKSLQPDADLKPKLEGFRFSDEKTGADAEPTSPSRMGRYLLIDGLGKGG